MTLVIATRDSACNNLVPRAFPESKGKTRGPGNEFTVGDGKHGRGCPWKINGKLGSTVEENGAKPLTESSVEERSIRTAKFVRWLHSHVTVELSRDASWHPSRDHPPPLSLLWKSD